MSKSTPGRSTLGMLRGSRARRACVSPASGAAAVLASHVDRPLSPRRRCDEGRAAIPWRCLSHAFAASRADGSMNQRERSEVLPDFRAFLACRSPRSALPRRVMVAGRSAPGSRPFRRAALGPAPGLRTRFLISRRINQFESDTQTLTLRDRPRQDLSEWEISILANPLPGVEEA